MFRQGDVAIIPIEEIPNFTPEKGEKVDRDHGRVVLAYGEVTGHAHAIASDKCDLYKIADGKSINDNDRILVCLDAVSLKHEEHASINLPKGIFIVRRQREYHPDEIRSVAD